MNSNSNTQNSILNLPVELRDEVSLRLARRTNFTIAATVLALIAWAAIAPVEEVAVARGKVVPASSIGDVHHYEGGIVEKIHVREGEQVRRGEILLTLRPEQVTGDLSQLESRAANLSMKRERLTASLNGREPDFGMLGERFPGLKSEHALTFEKERVQAGEARRQLELAVQRIDQQLASAKAEAESLVDQVQLHAEQATIRQTSQARGYTSKTSLLQARTALEQTRQRLVAANGRADELAKMLEEASTKLRETDAERLRRLSEESAETAAQLAEANEALAKHRDRVQRLDVVSPMEGIVQSLVYKVTGEVVKPGAVVAQIVPDGEVIAEVELQPSDIGHVNVGNPAEIKLSNYDPNVVGIIRGRVDLISATTFEDKDGLPFYRVRIAFEKDHLDVGGRELPISPGTTLDAQILTGSKTLLRYMLKPVYQSFDTAFAER
ncbi:MAG: HlyD family type I secretion periplasmic adaptor subunit [Rhodomicrobiaceae bacterium]